MLQVIHNDCVNAVFHMYQFDTDQQCRDHLTEMYGLDKTTEWFLEKPEDRVLINEHQGELYSHWVYLRYDPLYDTLFDYKRRPDAPKTREDLLKYMIDGGAIMVQRSTRAPCEVKVFRNVNIMTKAHAQASEVDPPPEGGGWVYDVIKGDTVYQFASEYDRDDWLNTNNYEPDNMPDDMYLLDGVYMN